MSIIFDNARIFKNGIFFPKQKILVEKGKVVSVGSRVLKHVEKVVNCEQKYIVPGLIDAHSHLGLFDGGHCGESQDLSELNEKITPQLRPLDGIKMRDRSLDDARRAGVTCCMVCPGSDLPIAGQCSILKTNGNSADVGLVIEQAGILMSFGEKPKAAAQKSKQELGTRMGITALIRETLMRAQDYLALKQSKKGVKERDIQLESLLPLINGDVPIRACAHRAEDIMAAIRIADEFELKIVIEHGTEAHLVAKYLAERDIPVVLGPSLVPRARTELNQRTFESAKILDDAGVKVALTCDYPGLPIESLRIAAAMAIQYGLSEKLALQAITEVPAKILGISERTGRIKKGYDADLAIFSGHPLDIRSRLEAVMIDGDLFNFSDAMINA